MKMKKIGPREGRMSKILCRSVSVKSNIVRLVKVDSPQKSALEPIESDKDILKIKWESTR